MNKIDGGNLFGQGVSVVVAPAMAPAPAWPVVAPAPAWPGGLVDDTIAVDDVRALLARLLGCPLSDCRIVDQVGRCVLVEYTPLQARDPDIVLAVWPGARPINDAILDIQEARAVSWGSWAGFYDGLDGYVKRLEAVTERASITAEERAFLVSWAARVRDTGSAIGNPVNSRVPRVSFDYWGEVGR